MSMMEALGGGGGGYGPPPGPMPGTEAGPPSEDAGGGEDFENSLEALTVAEEALQAFIRLDPDHADRAIAAQCLQNVIKLKAANQSGASEGSMSSMARALAGGPTANLGLAGG
jgi:hypothetical protein